MLISCSKSDTPTTVDDNTTVSNTPPYTSYYSNTHVQANMIGQWSIYKHTHVRHDSTYEAYTSQPNNTIEFTANNIQYNTTN